MQLEVQISGLNPSHGVPAADWLQEVSVEELGLNVSQIYEISILLSRQELAWVIYTYGEDLVVLQMMQITCEVFLNDA